VVVVGPDGVVVEAVVVVVLQWKENQCEYKNCSFYNYDHLKLRAAKIKRKYYSNNHDWQKTVKRQHFPLIANRMDFHIFIF